MQRDAERSSHQLASVSALFDSRKAVDDVVVRLVNAGVPRDLIEVVVSPEAARRFYGGRALSPGRETLRYAGIGGLVGLVIGALITLVLVALPGFQEPGVLAFVQLLGPNMTTVGGAAIGAAIGLFVRRRADRRYARAAEAPALIVVVVSARGVDEAAGLSRLLAQGGGREPRIEP